MEWWSIFRKIRSAIFICIAIASLVWAVILSVYLVKEWDHFSTLQRSIVIGMISVNGLTTLIQYLMIVCIFKVWVDFARMLFLIAIHIASSLLYTLFGAGFSCAIFENRAICSDVEVAFLAGSWAITGLLVGYTLYLCIMSRVPFPIPKVTPNLLLSAPPSRRSSQTSINSATRLLRRADSPSSSPNRPVEMREANVYVPKKQLYVVNGLASPVSPAVPPSLRVRPIGSYGAMGSPRLPQHFEATSPAVSIRSWTSSPSFVSIRSANISPVPPSLRTGSPSPSMRQNALVRLSRTFSQKRDSKPPVLPLTNPFMSPMSRNGTPDSFYSTTSMDSSAPGSFGPMYLSPHQIPPLTGIGQKSESKEEDVPDTPSTIYSLYSQGSSRDSWPTASVLAADMSPYDPRSSPTMGSTISSPPRMHTATPASIHSVAPSVHFHPSDHAPPIAHIRAYSDPIYRLNTASPRIPHATPISHHPTPFAMVGADIRRYGSIGHQRDLEKGLHAVPSQGTRNAMHFQAAMGRPAFGHGYWNGINSAAGPAGRVTPVARVTRDQWKQLVLSAAASGR